MSDDFDGADSVDVDNTFSFGPATEETPEQDSPVKILQFSQVQAFSTSIPFDVSKFKEIRGNSIKNIYDNVEYLRNLGFNPLATKAGSKFLKKVIDTDKSYDSTNFEPGDNISIRIGAEKNKQLGLESEFSVVDLDLEVEEARIFAYHLLNQKSMLTMTYGRRSAPGSHYLFRVRTKEIKAKKNQLDWPAGMRSRNKNDDGSIILELKPSGHCLVPPSAHPTGEKLFWMTDQTQCITISFSDIYRLAGKIAAGAILLRCWAEGLRDNIVISTAGWLLKEGWHYKEVAEFMNALFSCAWPIDSNDIRRWRIRIQTLSNDINKAKEKGDLTEIGENDDYGDYVNPTDSLNNDIKNVL